MVTGYEHKVYEFQFTPLREGRLLPNKKISRGAYFNSRPSARGDEILQSADGRTLEISIHAPPRGATNALNRLPAITIYFNSRPSARGDSYTLML